MCPAEWRMFSSSCYLLSSQPRSWKDSRKDCRERGADLVVIDSSHKQTFISGIINRDTWIGLTDRDEEGTWKWVDGTPLTLKRWETAQPDNGSGNPRWGDEDCAHVRAITLEWNDLSCKSALGWICEKKA
ncbi:hypothetical protein PFLUV_G00148770 [Perca fluviatilis]|uniref:C-type lectin domain-containing protein n=1 Tax=Perca fluviatilis TaxID=8168 RepID=A0A6A5F3L2_PERFL|nr:hypothetical protein PFLUV_G00148770 [Perca fluviatilis]